MTNINYITGDATRPVGSGTKVICHCCNDRGLWGSGFVLALSARWDKPELEYKKWYNDGVVSNVKFELGNVLVVRADLGIYVANIIGQHGIRGAGNKTPVRYTALSSGFEKISQLTGIFSDMSVHMPRLGCDRAGGDWDVVEQMVIEEICSKDIPVTVYDLPTIGG